MKIAVLADSNSGITQKEAGELGVYVLPMPFMIDGETFFEGIDLSHDDFYRRQMEGADISTSQPSPEDVLKMWDRLLAENDQVVYIPMSSGLSGSCQTAVMLASDEKYEGKVFVVNNQRVSVTQEDSVRDALVLAARGKTGEEIKDRLEETRFDSVIYITVDTLKYLKKGGRITPAAAALGTLLKLKPVLTILGEKLDAFAKARTMKQAKSVMLTAIQKDLETKFADRDCKRTRLEIAYSNNEEASLEWKRELSEAFPGVEIEMAPLSLSIACHVGPGILAVAATKRLDEEYED